MDRIARAPSPHRNRRLSSSEDVTSQRMSVGQSGVIEAVAGGANHADSLHDAL
jgi:hypothetical protein